MAKTVVLLCSCFGEIDGVLPLEGIAGKLRQWGDGLSVYVMPSLCMEQDAERIETLLKKEGADSVVAGGCSPRARREALRRALEKAGIDPVRCADVDLREGCAWIHRNDPAGAARKAADLLAMGLASLEARGVSRDVSTEVRPECLVIGAGPAGLAAASALARQGVTTHLVERSAQAGGMLNLLSRVYPGNEDGKSRIEPFLRELGGDSRIVFHPRSRVLSVKGFAGDFKVLVQTAEGPLRVRAGAVIVATGAGVFLPAKMYRYGELKQVVTLMELERQWIRGIGDRKRFVFIQCVGARCPERPYCSTICCPSSLKNAVRVMEEVPGGEATVLHRDIMTPGSVLEDYYRKAMETGVRFVRFREDEPPEVAGTEKVEGVRVRDAAGGKERTLPADAVILATPLVPGVDNRSLKDLLGIELDGHGFFAETYPLHPLETRMEGIFIAGSARWPVSSEQAAAQGEGAAVKALGVLRRNRISALSLGRVPGRKLGHGTVEDRSCTGCGNCVAVCPFLACALQDRGNGRFVSRVNKMRCKGCGNCVSVCPNGTMQIPEHNYRMVGAMIRKAFSE
jgi:heterodisulfide reductase subunit A